MNARFLLSARSHLAAVVTFALFGLIGPSTAKADVFALVCQGNGNFSQLDITTGIRSLIRSNGTKYGGLAFNADETVLYGIIFPTISAPSSLVTINQSTGLSAVVGPNGVALTTVTNLANGRLFGVDTSDSLYEINPTTGAATLIGPTGLPALGANFANSLASNGTDLYYTLATGGGISSLYTLNYNNGGATLVGSTGVSNIAGSAFAGPTFDTGQLYGFRAAGQTVTIDLATGVATPLNSNGIFDLFGGVGIITTVPEPASISLLVFSGLPLLLRRRARSDVA